MYLVPTDHFRANKWSFPFSLLEAITANLVFAITSHISQARLDSV